MADVVPLPDSGGMLSRLGLATASGGVLGLHRELHDKRDGLRTHTLVALGAAPATDIGIEVTASGKVADPGAVTRVIRGVPTGIGFLGAGVIFRDEGGKAIQGPDHRRGALGGGPPADGVRGGPLATGVGGFRDRPGLAALRRADRRAVHRRPRPRGTRTPPA